ncbi:MAG TPA: hypothetical protein VFF73_22455 [Planctomycetota bacterium]|nr:hypothetical protein [Planctomycetota bacterium]
MRQKVQPVEHGLAAIVALFLSAVPGLALMGFRGREVVVEAFAESIPAGVALALVARAKNPIPWALLAVFVVHTVSNVWSAAIDAGSLEYALRSLSRLFSWAYEGWTGALLLGASALSFIGAAKLKGSLLEGLALATPAAMAEATFYSVKLPQQPLLPVLVHATALAILLPLAERIATRAFVALGIRDAGFGAPPGSE